MSKLLALWATSGSSPQNSLNARMASSGVGASATMASLMPVSSTIFCGMGLPGLTKLANFFSSLILPFSTTTAPISVRRSVLESNPVVSVSNTTKLPDSGMAS